MNLQLIHFRLLDLNRAVNIRHWINSVSLFWLLCISYGDNLFCCWKCCQSFFLYILYPSFRLCFIYHFEIRFWQNLIPNWCREEEEEEEVENRKSLHSLCSCWHSLKANYSNERDCFVWKSLCLLYAVYVYRGKKYLLLFVIVCFSVSVSIYDVFQWGNRVKIAHKTDEVRSVGIDVIFFSIEISLLSSYFFYIKDEF